MNNPIEKVEVVSETKCFVTIRKPYWSGNGKFINIKVKKNREVFNSFEEAKDALISKAEREINDIEGNLCYAKNKLQRFINLKNE